ncbi:hypothetical protein R1sor_002789 [Riccia sorocarpa]|uniref:Uncharacterized protein n=1 Tax=Riccia sorocarpa TaxID=122646 RepID=A0ABD3GZU3_9MARC
MIRGAANTHISQVAHERTFNRAEMQEVQGLNWNSTQVIEGPTISAAMTDSTAAMADSTAAMALGSSVMSSLKEAKEALLGRDLRPAPVLVRTCISRFGLRGTATYLGCPICSRSIHSRDRCGHDISIPKSFYRLKAYLEDDTAELEATAWEATRCFTGMSLDRFVAREMRDEESTIVDRCIGRTWILRLSRSKNHRGIYARIEHAEPVSRKSLFLVRSPCREEAAAQSLPSSPVSTISAFGDGSSPVSSGTSTGAVDSTRDKSREADNASREQYRRGFGSGFLSCTILVSIGMSKLVLFILALACYVVRKCH